MSEHLSDRQFSEWMAGERPEELVAHVGVCAACRGEVTRFDALLGSYREGVRSMSAEAPVIRVPTVRWVPRLVLVGALATLLAAITLYPPRPAPVAVAAVEVSDLVLFEQVNAQLARRVPGAMEPLAALTWPEGKSE